MSNPTKRFNGIVSEIRLTGAEQGSLRNRNFVAKDLFDVAGERTGGGNPDWQRTHAPAGRNAQSIVDLLQSGATLVGKSCTDELAYSIDGVNIHWGTPANPQYAERVCGGSSSGSASAVAACLVDFAVGTDTGGSVRVPASYCGIYGLRPTWGRISTAGVIPLAPSFDTIGWFARTPELLEQCGSVLMHTSSGQAVYEELLIAEEAFALMHENFKTPMNKFLEKLVNCFSKAPTISLSSMHWTEFPEHFRIMQAYEAWQAHGQWIKQYGSSLDQAIRERFLFGQNVTQSQYMESKKFKESTAKSIDKVLAQQKLLCLPTTWNLPPLLNASAEDYSENRKTNMRLTSLSSLTGVPQIVMPLRISSQNHTGVSLIAPRGMDMSLLRIACELSQNSVLEVV